MPSPLPNSEPPRRRSPWGSNPPPDDPAPQGPGKTPRSRRKLKHAAIWLAIGFAVFAAISFKDEVNVVGDRLLSELLPHRGATAGDQISFRSSDGTSHFVIEADVDGTPLRFLVDTGATDVVISPSDARRMGIDPATLTYNRVYRTANGIVRGAPIIIKTMRVGPITLNNVRASVNGAELNRSLLGMSFLGRLSSYSVSGDRLTLKK